MDAKTIKKYSSLTLLAFLKNVDADKFNCFTIVRNFLKLISISLKKFFSV